MKVPLSSGGLSDYPDCSPNERCSPESMVGTMRREPSSFQGREEVSLSANTAMINEQ